MDTSAVYAKTELGQRELKERTLKLPVQMRGLLIIIDGNRTAADVLDKAKMLGLDRSALEALEVGGLIARKSPQSPAPAATPPDPDAEDRLRRGQRVIAEAIDRHLGLRGYALGLRLKRTTSVAELDEVLGEFRAALSRRIGFDKAAPIVADVEVRLALQ